MLLAAWQTKIFRSPQGDLRQHSHSPPRQVLSSCFVTASWRIIYCIYFFICIFIDHPKLSKTVQNYLKYCGARDAKVLTGFKNDWIFLAKCEESELSNVIQSGQYLNNLPRQDSNVSSIQSTNLTAWPAFC